MNIFNSLGSNYSVFFTLKSLLIQNQPKLSIKLKQKLETRYSGKAVLTYKGRDALSLALSSFKLKPESEVAITGFTCFAVYLSIVSAGLKPHYIDIDDSLNFSPHALLKALKSHPQIKVVIIQNTLGFPSQAQAILKICKKHNLKLVEDLAHSAGCRYSSQIESGKLADATVLSFSQDKIIDGISGGAVIFHKLKPDVKSISKELKSVSSLTQIRDRLYPIFTLIIRVTYPVKIGKLIHALLKAAKLLSPPVGKSRQKLTYCQLPHWYSGLALYSLNQLESNLAYRKSIAQVYQTEIKTGSKAKFLSVSVDQASNLRFPLLVSDKLSLINFLKKFGIHISDTWYDAPIAPKKYLSKTDYQMGTCPQAEQIASTLINLPTHQHVSIIQAKKISHLINLWQSQ